MKKTWIVSATAGVLVTVPLHGYGAPTATTGSGGSQTGGQSVEGQPSEGQPAAQLAAQNTQGVTDQAGGKKAAEGTATTFWYSMGGMNGEALDYLASQFNGKNELSIKVEAQHQEEYDDAINKLKSAQIGNMGVDLVQTYDIGTRSMTDLGWVIPTQELIDGDDWDKPVIEPNIAAYYTVDEKLYSTPFSSSTSLLYYNKNMPEKAGISGVPESLGEIAGAADALVQKGGAGEPISLGIYGWFSEQFTCKQELSYVNNDNGRQGAATTVELNQNGAAVNTSTVWKDLYDEGYAPIAGRGGDSGLADLSSGKPVMTLGSTVSLKQILEDVNGRFEVDIAHFPKVNPEDKGGASIGGASLWAPNSEDEAKKAATWELVKYLVPPESQAHWDAQIGYFPVTTTAHEEPVFKENLEKYPQFGIAIDQLHDPTPEPVGALISIFLEARQVAEAEIENMLNNRVSPQDTVANMAKQISKVIEGHNLLNEW